SVVLNVEVGRGGKFASIKYGGGGGEVRRLVRPADLSGHVFAAAFGQESAVAACDEGRAILKRDPECSLLRMPVRENRSAHVPPVAATRNGSVDHVSGANVREREGGPIPHQDRRVAGEAVSTSMKTSAVRVDAPAEA